MEQKQEENITSILSKRVNDYNVIHVRLDTSEILNRIELFLRGARLVVIENNETGRIESKRVELGKRKANDDGVQAILNWVSATVNPQTVQGNFPIERDGFSPAYERYIEEYHIELTEFLITNCYTWEINDDEINGIIEFIMLLIQPFMSRLIDNKERESYNETLKSMESNVMRAKGGIPFMNS